MKALPMAEKRLKKSIPFSGFGVDDVPRLMLSRGEVIARYGRLLSRPGRGQLVLWERKPG